MDAEFEASKETGNYCGDVTTCICCHKELTWCRFTDGEYGYVDCWDSAVCPDENGHNWVHEPSYTPFYLQ